MKRIAVLTGGGDAPGLNAVIRAVTKTAINLYGCEVFGIVDSYDGFIGTRRCAPIGSGSRTRHSTARRHHPWDGQPWQPVPRKVMQAGEEVIIDVSNDIVKAIAAMHLDAGHRHWR